MIKELLKSAYCGIRDASVIFLFMCIILGVTGADSQFASGYGIARAGVAVIIIGVGFGVPSLIYRTKLGFGLKVFIHMGTGCFVMIVASFIGGWLNFETGLGYALITLAIQLLSAFIIWGCYLLSAKLEAKRINMRIASKNRSEGTV